MRDWKARVPPMRMQRSTARWVAFLVVIALGAGALAGRACELQGYRQTGWWAALALVSLVNAATMVRIHEGPAARGASSRDGFFGGLDLVLWAWMSLLAGLGAFSLTSAIRDDHSGRGVGFFFAIAAWALVSLVYWRFWWWWFRSPAEG